MKQRFIDLANQCYQNGHYTFTHFLSLADQADFYEIQREISFVDYAMEGGSELAERMLLRFGSEEMFGYEEPFPISCIHCKPMTPKFAEVLSHRDVLGALMHLGVERDVLGDIWVKEKECYIFCLTSMAEYICDQLTKIRHTNVTCQLVEELPEECKPKRKEEEHNMASVRCDVVVASVYKLSRSKCIPLFQEKKIFVNGRQFENNSGILREGDTVSVRGFGKFTYKGILRETKKGRYTVQIERYI